jgi:16S rRNA (guanine527-N7)-methyltransferase
MKPTPPTPSSIEDLQAILDFDDRIREALCQYDALLQKWQKRFNLVGPSTLKQSVQRHFFDSAQLIEHIKCSEHFNRESAVLVDLGSGAGFPGLVLSILAQAPVHLVESDANKCEFLRQVVRATGASAVIHRTRIEHYDGPKADIVTARVFIFKGPSLARGIDAITFSMAYRRSGALQSL